MLTLPAERLLSASWPQTTLVLSRSRLVQSLHRVGAGLPASRAPVAHRYPPCSLPSLRSVLSHHPHNQISINLRCLETPACRAELYMEGSDWPVTSDL